MKNIMIDLETIDTRITAGILSIGAVIFDLESGEIGESFRVDIGIDNAQRDGTESISTMEFWYGQDTELRKQQFYPKEPMTTPTAIGMLADFIDDNIGISRVIPWSNGATFDISILSHKFDCLELTIPWAHWNIRDVRTLIDLGKVDKKDFPFIGRPHDPVDDCIHQIRMCQKAWWNVS